MDRTTKFMAIVIMLILIAVLFTLMPAEGDEGTAPTPTVPPIWVTTEPTYPQPPTAQPPVGYPGPDGPAPAASSFIYLPIIGG